MENRLRRLQMEDERLQKQIHLARKHSVYADEVKLRKEQDYRDKCAFKQACQDAIDRQRAINNERRYRMRDNMREQKERVMMNNFSSRNELVEMVRTGLAETNKNKEHLSSIIKQSTDNIYKHKQEAKAHERAALEYRHAETSWANHNLQKEHASNRENTEKRIQELAEYERVMIEKLQKTMIKKEKAIKELGKKSPALKKVQNPRNAYKYKSPEPVTEGDEKQTKRSVQVSPSEFKSLRHFILTENNS